MSQFGEYLRELLYERSLSISELSRISGVERTSLQKSITGNRMLSHDSVEKLIWSLQLTPEESEKLRYCYEIFFIGEDRYQSRRIICRMLENLVCIGDEDPSACPGKAIDFSGISSDFMTEENTLVTGKENVKHVIQSVFFREISRRDGEVELTMPTDMGFFNEFLFCLYKKNKARVKVMQIIAINRSKTEKKLNLHSVECFADILPVCLVSDRQYHPYYYYDTSISRLYTDPFPYFVVTRDCVVCMAADGEKAFLLNGAEYAAFYRKHFHILKGHCHALVNYSEDLVSSLEEYARVYDPDSMYVCTHQPCFACECDDEKIRSKIRKDFPGCEEITEACVEWLSCLKNVGMYHSFFKPEGVISFMEEGRLDDFPEIVEEITPEERLELLEMLIFSVESEKRTSVRMFNGKVFTYPSFISLVTSLKKGMGIFTTSRFENGGPPICVYVHEPDVSRAFHDFMVSLPASKITCSKEETLRYLKNIHAFYAEKFRNREAGAFV